MGFIKFQFQQKNFRFVFEETVSYQIKKLSIAIYPLSIFNYDKVKKKSVQDQ